LGSVAGDRVARQTVWQAPGGMACCELMLHWCGSGAGCQKAVEVNAGCVIISVSGCCVWQWLHHDGRQSLKP
jgi:hypothetical protein